VPCQRADRATFKTATHESGDGVAPRVATHTNTLRHIRGVRYRSPLTGASPESVTVGSGMLIPRIV
jgi:hypothetical protein